MINVWLTSDTHFNHANIISFCDRPFANLTDMNEALIGRWNAVVKSADYVVHLGDVCMGLTDDADPILRRLNGRKLVVLGNHDTKPAVSSSSASAGRWRRAWWSTTCCCSTTTSTATTTTSWCCTAIHTGR